MTKYFMHYSSPLGPFYLLSDGEALIFAGFETQLPPIKFIEGTEFQKAVWQELIKIPYGKLTTYKQIGDAVKKTLKKDKMSYRAIGHAVGQNPLSIFVPCHRVIGSNNSLVGYAGGLHLKEALLQLEGHSLDKFKR